VLPLIVAASVAFGAPTVVVGGHLGIVGWQRSGNHAALLGLQAASRVRGRVLGGSLELDAALARDRNAGATLTTWPLRAATTLDVVVRRRSAHWVTGLGPGVAVVASRIQTDDRRYGGVAIGPVLRARSGLDGPLTGKLRWQVGTGMAVRRGGVDWDLGVGLLVQP